MIMYDDLKFNFFYRQKVKEGEKCKVVSLKEIDFSQIDCRKKDNSPLLQNFDCGYRIAKGNVGDFKDWNLTTFTDLDWKKYKHNGEYVFAKPSDTDKTKWEWISEKSKNLFYHMYKMFVDELFYVYEECIFSQQSFSECSFHVISKFNCERNESNYRKASKCVVEMCHRVAKSLGKEYEEILNYPGVMDECVTHIGQGIYMTDYQVFYNEYPQHYVNHSINLDNIQLDEEEIEKIEIVFHSDKKAKIRSRFSTLPGGYSYPNVRRLMWIVFSYFNFDKDKCKEVWERFIPEILKQRGGEKSEKELWKEFNEAYKNHRGKNYPFKGEILEWSRINFGFKFQIQKEFKPQIIETYKPDIEYTLKPNQTLSDIDIKWSKDKINHLFAGCGFGKTHMGKKYGEKVNEESAIDWIFNNRFFQKGVCFITPMKSISRDSFKDVKDWVVIDTDNKDENIERYSSIRECINQNQNICVTWESFVLYKMYELPFDYIIVDEAHTWYMYDYRINSITDIKRYLMYSSAIKILMTGTPSYEVEEFDCFKIKVNKEIPKVKSHIVFYNNQYMGYIIKDIKEWIKDSNHYALIFKDKANYKDEENWDKYYGLKIDMFNSKYEENVEYILNNHTVKNQVTMFSVYSQAGINLYLEGKKVRIYIINNTGLGIIQYANRIRNKECIDKVIIPLQIKSIRNSYKRISERDFTEGMAYMESKIAAINKLKNPVGFYDIVTTKTDDIINFRYNIPIDCVSRMGDKLTLNENTTQTYLKILSVMRYERQTQVIYNRLVENNFDVDFEMLEKDELDTKNTKLKSSNFAGVIVRFNWNVLKQHRNTGCFWIDVNEDKAMKKVLSDGVIQDLTEIFQYLMRNPFSNDFEEMKKRFSDIVGRYILEKGSITTKDIKDIKEMLYFNSEWDNLYNNGVLYLLVRGNVDTITLTSAYMRSKYSDGMDWNDFIRLCDEAYLRINRLGKTFSMFKDLFSDRVGDKMNSVNDEITQAIYKGLVSKHKRGVVGGKKKGKKSNCVSVVIEGVEYQSKKEAAASLGITRQALDKRLKKLKK